MFTFYLLSKSIMQIYFRNFFLHIFIDFQQVCLKGIFFKITVRYFGNNFIWSHKKNAFGTDLRFLSKYHLKVVLYLFHILCNSQTENVLNQCRSHFPKCGECESFDLRNFLKSKYRTSISFLTTYSIQTVGVGRSD